MSRFYEVIYIVIQEVGMLNRLHPRGSRLKHDSILLMIVVDGRGNVIIISRFRLLMPFLATVLGLQVKHDRPITLAMATQ